MLFLWRCTFVTVNSPEFRRHLHALKSGPSGGAMSNSRYPEEFNIQAVDQVTKKKLTVADVAARLGVSTHSLYAWIKRNSKP